MRKEEDSKFVVEFYETLNGRQPAKDFIVSLDKKVRAKTLSMVSILQDNGYELREPYSKHIADRIFELRIKLGSDAGRILYFFYVDKHIILTNGFVKRTKKTPAREIARAKAYRNDYLKRKADRNEC